MEEPCEGFSHCAVLQKLYFSPSDALRGVP
jgi:hypothetical protein